MQIKRLQATFQLPLENASYEKIGFSVTLDEGETAESVVPQLRQRAMNITGKRSNQLYKERREMEEECEQLEARLKRLRKEWDATAEFLKAQGLNPVAPSMPQFQNLLAAVTVEAVEIGDGDDEDYEDHEDDDDDY